MSKLIGSFYFKQSRNKNLIGEYFNNKNFKINVECSNFIEALTDELFVGIYSTIWNESNDSHVAKLEIKKHHENIYKLTWKNVDGNEIYIGDGMICDGVLIGYYTNI